MNRRDCKFLFASFLTVCLEDFWFKFCIFDVGGGLGGPWVWCLATNLGVPGWIPEHTIKSRSVFSSQVYSACKNEESPWMVILSQEGPGELYSLCSSILVLLSSVIHNFSLPSNLPTHQIFFLALLYFLSFPQLLISFVQFLSESDQPVCFFSLLRLL